MESIGRSVRYSRDPAPLGHGQAPNLRTRAMRVYRRDDHSPHDCEPIDGKELLATGAWLTEDEFGAALAARPGPAGVV